MRWILTIEFLAIFVVLPAALAAKPLPWWPLPLLWVIAAYCYRILKRQPGFDAQKFWQTAPAVRQIRSMLLLFVPAAAMLTLGVYMLAPEMFLNLPRRSVLVWGLVLLLYPVFSVIPQTIVYRAFLFHRYGSLFQNPKMILVASGLAFAWLHIVLRNPLAPLLTLPGGLLFAWRYEKTRSVLASAAEHALYGCFIFTVGLGAYFFSGPA